MHIFTFSNHTTQSVITLIATNAEAAKAKLGREVESPSEWEAQVSPDVYREAQNRALQKLAKRKKK